VSPPAHSEYQPHQLTGPYDRRVIPLAGHFLAREAPAEVVQALKTLVAGPR
jgi:pimeloyl-ACP methyl ester carboxylesterase